MNSEHLIAALFAAVLLWAFLVDYREAGRDTPVRVRLVARRRPPLRDER